MRLLNFILILTTTFTAFSQLTGTMTVDQNNVCLLDTEPQITFTASGGTAPYTFNYTINNGPIQTVTGNPTTTLLVSTLIPDYFTYTLVSVEDASLNSAVLNTVEYINVYDLPIIDAGPDQYLCAGVSVALNGTGGMTYIWNNGIVNGVPFTPTVGAITYWVTGMDFNGCSNSDNVTLFVTPNPTATTVVDSAYCDNGTIQLYASGGTPPYVYTWSNGATTPDIWQLLGGDYICTITDINGCSSSVTATVPTSVIPGICASISGTVMIDYDQSCSISGVDNPLQYRMIRALPGNQFTLTDADGNYTLNLLPGNYDIEQVDNSTIYSPTCQTLINVDLPDATSAVTGINFFDTISGTSDLQISFTTSPIRPGFYSNVYLNVCDMSGNALGSQDIWFTIPDGITLTQFSFPYTQSNDTVYATVTFGSSCISLWGTIFGQSVLINDVLVFNAGVDQAAGEVNLINNETVYTTIVVASYDPNDKTMFLNGMQSDSTILLTDQVLEYVVRFQNTGTASAIDIYVLDSISETLDLGSFEFIASSHPCSVSIEDRTLKFDFPGINLPDSTSNEPESHGFFRYRIRQAQTNQVGTVINNTAYIYFDLNEAVITNTTYDEIVEPSSGINEIVFSEVHLYPNPTSDDLKIQSDIRLLHAVVTDLSGKVIHETALTGHIAQLGVQSLPAGHYLVRIEMEGRVVYRRFVKQ
ncbi:MAG: T9SS type A sorting domain-containing protein [Bacteroidetes bacterium]|nr:MAG: T9SS type A sorting domain-containing protein [Bacteroidota bacterium]